jgi:predicted TIM-barrel fold metal-dependent hydrolase
VDEARLVVAAHPGFDDGYRDVEDAIARSWGYESRRRHGPVSSLNFYEPYVDAVMHDRLIHDFMVAVVAHGLFERHPHLHFASIENGAGWVPNAIAALRRFQRATRSALTSDPVEQFREHVWVTPFISDTVPALLEYMPVERILFGSDWPHAEGLADPKQYFDYLTTLSVDDRRKVMRDNARELTFP